MGVGLWAESPALPWLRLRACGVPPSQGRTLTSVRLLLVVSDENLGSTLGPPMMEPLGFSYSGRCCVSPPAHFWPCHAPLAKASHVRAWASLGPRPRAALSTQASGAAPESGWQVAPHDRHSSRILPLPRHRRGAVLCLVSSAWSHGPTFIGPPCSSLLPHFGCGSATSAGREGPRCRCVRP